MTPDNAPKSNPRRTAEPSTEEGHMPNTDSESYDLTVLAFRRSGWTANPSLTSRVQVCMAHMAQGGNRWLQDLPSVCRFCDPFGKHGPSKDASPMLQSYAEGCLDLQSNAWGDPSSPAPREIPICPKQLLYNPTASRRCRIQAASHA